jgi:hypothetical protein
MPFRRVAAAAAALLLCASAGGTPVAAWGQPADLSFMLVNNSGRAITEVYAAPAGFPRWGHDRLGSEAIPSGRSHRIRLAVDGNCAYDLRVVYQGGAAETRRGIDICSLARVVFGAGAGAGAPPEKGGSGQRAGAQEAMGDPSFSLLKPQRPHDQRGLCLTQRRQDLGPRPARRGGAAAGAVLHGPAPGRRHLRVRPPCGVRRRAGAGAAAREHLQPRQPRLPLRRGAARGARRAGRGWRGLARATSETRTQRTDTACPTA